MKSPHLVLAALAACVPEAEDAFWQPAAERDPDLAIEASLTPALARTGAVLRVVTFNVSFGRNVDALAAALSAPPLDKADVFLIQEIEDDPDEGGSRASRIAALTRMAHVYLPAGRPGGGATQGLAILARREMSNVRFMILPRFPNSIRRDDRVALAVNIAGVDVVNLHLRLQLGIAQRAAQLEPATRGLAPLAIVGGDFNTNPYAWADVLPVLSSQPITDLDVPAIIDELMSELGYDPVTADSGPTQFSVAGALRLDSIYSRGLAALGPPTVERDIDLSDHWPVWVDLELPDASTRTAPE